MTPQSLQESRPLTQEDSITVPIRRAAKIAQTEHAECERVRLLVRRKWGCCAAGYSGKCGRVIGYQTM